MRCQQSLSSALWPVAVCPLVSHRVIGSSQGTYHELAECHGGEGSSFALHGLMPEEDWAFRPSHRKCVRLPSQAVLGSWIDRQGF